MGLHDKLKDKPPTGANGGVTRSMRNPARVSSAIADSSTRRASYAHTRSIRSQSVEPIDRKNSLPEIKTEKLPPSSTSRLSIHQRKSKKGPSELESNSNVPSISGSRSSVNFNNTANHNANNASIQKKRRPFSFSRGFQNDPKTEESFNKAGGGDYVQGFQLSSQRNTDNHETSSNVGKRSPRVHFSDGFNARSDSSSNSDSPSDVDVDETRTNINTNISVSSKAEEIRQQSENLITVSSPPVFSTGNGETSEGRLFESAPDNKSSTLIPQPIENSTKPLAPNDQIMIAKTDNLIMEVAKFITQIKCTRAHNFPVDMNFNSTTDGYHFQSHNNSFVFDNNPFNLSSESIEALSSIRCPSAVQLQSGQSTARGSHTTMNSRPASASTMIRSVSNEDIHGRIALTLKMIEQEEQREMHNLQTMRANSIPNNIQNCNNIDSRSFATNNRPITTNLSNSDMPSEHFPVIPSFHGSRPSSRSSLKSELNLTQDESQSLQFIPQYNNHYQPLEPSPRFPEINSTFNLSPSSSGQSVRERPISRSMSSINSARLCTTTTPSHLQNSDFTQNEKSPSRELAAASGDSIWESTHQNTKKIFSFLDEVERTDRETLLGLKYDHGSEYDTNSRNRIMPTTGSGNNLSSMQTIDALIRKGPVELAKEQIILDRKLEESNQRIQVLEETLIHQRELNMRNLRNCERDLKKRLRLQKEEFDIAFTRNEALINEMAAEKRILQERCDKLMRNFDETEEKYKEQIKSLQQKHLDEIKRLRKAQASAESVKKQQWVGSKAQEIREMTVKGLEPEVQRIIQRHQQEMSEMRAWHVDEIRETEERYQRKSHMQLQDMREKFSKELEEIVAREREVSSNKLDAILKQRDDEFETERKRMTNDLYEERERSSTEEIKLKEMMQENVRKAQIKGEVEKENLQQEYELKIQNIEKRHANELKSLKDVHEAEKDNWMASYIKKYENAMKEREIQVTESLRGQMDSELRDREKKLRDEFEKIRKEDENAFDSRMRRVQEKFTSELYEMDKAEKELKGKFSQAKSELLNLEEKLFTTKASLSAKEKQNSELQDANSKMIEERSNLTSVIRREFSHQIEILEDDVRSMKTSLVELQTKHKLDLEHKQIEIEKILHDKDAEIDKIGMRVKQTLSRKEETIQELQKQMEKSNFQIQHLEELLDEQRKNILESMTTKSTSNISRKKLS